MLVEHPDTSAILKSTFGFDDFRPGQAEIVDYACQGPAVAR